MESLSQALKRAWKNNEDQQNDGWGEYCRCVKEMVEAERKIA